jgi:hypothetical protein
VFEMGIISALGLQGSVNGKSSVATQMIEFIEGDSLPFHLPISMACRMISGTGLGSTRQVALWVAMQLGAGNLKVTQVAVPDDDMPRTVHLR